MDRAMQRVSKMHYRKDTGDGDIHPESLATDRSNRLLTTSASRAEKRYRESGEKDLTYLAMTRLGSLVLAPRYRPNRTFLGHPLLPTLARGGT